MYSAIFKHSCRQARCSSGNIPSSTTTRPGLQSRGQAKKKGRKARFRHSIQNEIMTGHVPTTASIRLAAQTRDMNANRATKPNKNKCIPAHARLICTCARGRLAQLSQHEYKQQARERGRQRERVKWYKSNDLRSMRRGLTFHEISKKPYLTPRWYCTMTRGLCGEGVPTRLLLHLTGTPSTGSQEVVATQADGS